MQHISNKYILADFIIDTDAFKQADERLSHESILNIAIVAIASKKQNTFV